ncbi:Lrp/AsnC family transcriptional regulator [Actibacterium lipolyticum]|uniref:Regulatory protein AsnC n=1 Tax=Actibacterium lipolyticum TaxID=1524263 RepID=A0A238JR94_9RHOB|nr:Lrp/AsnC family transcriptional regulator [Actibacterium lipolyticum]SMX32983.1 Regulatory protein AsnC [Actibacterium lipolyticum]
MDDLDERILSLLAGDARMSVAVMARKLAVARSTVQARLERLETSGVIAGYTLRLGETAKGGHIRATVLLSVEPRAQPPVLTRLKAIPEVQVAHTTSGRFDISLLVVTKTTADLDAMLDKLGEIPGVRSSESLIHLSTKIDRSV